MFPLEVKIKSYTAATGWAVLKLANNSLEITSKFGELFVKHHHQVKSVICPVL